MLNYQRVTCMRIWFSCWLNTSIIIYLFVYGGLSRIAIPNSQPQQGKNKNHMLIRQTDMERWLQDAVFRGLHGCTPWFITFDCRFLLSNFLVGYSTRVDLRVDFAKIIGPPRNLQGILVQTFHLEFLKAGVVLENLMCKFSGSMLQQLERIVRNENFWLQIISIFNSPRLLFRRTAAVRLLYTYKTLQHTHIYIKQNVQTQMHGMLFDPSEGRYLRELEQILI